VGDNDWAVLLACAFGVVGACGLLVFRALGVF
jgi:predicted outer membrane lipoprotein